MIIKQKERIKQCLSNLEITSFDKDLPAREKQILYLNKAFRRSIKNPGGPGHVFYIYGQPGTGKTATISYLTNTLKRQYAFELLEINCFSIRKIDQLYKIIYGKLYPEKSQVTNETARTQVFQVFNSSKASAHHYFVILDEFEHLYKYNKKNFDNEFYTLFSLTHEPNVSMSIVCIANGINLYENAFSVKTLSRLGNINYCFPSYKYNEIIEILSSKSEVITELFENNALELLCRKVSAKTGDMRYLLGLVSIIIEKYCLQAERLVTINDIMEECILFHDDVSISYEQFEIELLFEACMNEVVERRIVRFIYYLKTEIGGLSHLALEGNKNKQLKLFQSSTSLYKKYGQWGLLVLISVSDIIDAYQSETKLVSLLAQIQNLDT